MISKPDPSLLNYYILCCAFLGPLFPIPFIPLYLAHDLGVSAIFVQHLCHDFGEEGLPEKYRSMRDFVEGQTLLNEDLGRVEHFFAEARARAHIRYIRDSVADVLGSEGQVD